MRLSRPRTRSNSRYMSIVRHLQLLYTPFLVRNATYKRAGDSNLGWGVAGAGAPAPGSGGEEGAVGELRIEGQRDPMHPPIRLTLTQLTLTKIDRCVRNWYQS